MIACKQGFSFIAMAVAIWSTNTALASAFVYQSDPTRSAVSGIVEKGGLFSGLGHDHAVLIKQLDFKICMDRDNPTGAGFEVSVPAASIQIDLPEDRLRAGLKEKGPDVEDQKKIRKNMLDEDVLDVEHHPLITFKTHSLVRQPNVTDVVATLTLKGKSKELKFITNTVVLEGGVLHSWGDFKIDLDDFDIDPPSFLAFVNVKDEVQLKFDIYLMPSTQTCTPKP